jgi:hypothetical protein
MDLKQNGSHVARGENVSPLSGRRSRSFDNRPFAFLTCSFNTEGVRKYVLERFKLLFIVLQS